MKYKSAAVAVVLVAQLASPSSAFAQEAAQLESASDPSAIATQMASAAHVSRGRRGGASEVQNDLNAYLERSGLSVGPQYKGDSRVNVMTEVIRATKRPGERGFHTSRNTGYQRAYLKALGKFIAQREQEIANQLGSVFAENSDNMQMLRSICEPTRAQKIDAKLEQLAEAVIDEALRQVNSDPSPTAQPPRYDCPAQENLFRSKTKRSAAEALSGLRVVYSSEVDGQVGVVLVHSSKFEAAARLLLNDAGARWPDGDPLGELRTQLRSTLDTETLRGTFGTRILTASNGEPVIVAFGQAGPDVSPSDSDATYDRKFDAAQRIAYNEAAAELARFARAMAVFSSESSQVDESGKYVDLESGAFEEPELVAQTLLETVETQSLLKVQGITEVHKWEIEEDANGQALVGIVLAWSPSLRSTFGRDAAPPPSSAGPGYQQRAQHKAKGAEMKEDW